MFFYNNLALNNYSVNFLAMIFHSSFNDSYIAFIICHISTGADSFVSTHNIKSRMWVNM